MDKFMDAQEFFAQLPRGKEDKPLLFGFGPLEYNKDDIDGLYYMLDRDFSGCLLLNFAKPMNPEIQGRAWPVSYTHLDYAGGIRSVVPAGEIFL